MDDGFTFPLQWNIVCKWINHIISKVKEIMALSGICVSTKIKGEFKRWWHTFAYRCYIRLFVVIEEERVTSVLLVLLLTV